MKLVGQLLNIVVVVCLVASIFVLVMVLHLSSPPFPPTRGAGSGLFQETPTPGHLPIIDLKARWIGERKASLKWFQQSDANYICVLQFHPDGYGSLFDCFDVPTTPGWREVIIPHTMTEEVSIPQRGDTYKVRESRLDRDVQESIYYGEYGPVPLLYELKLLQVFNN